MATRTISFTHVLAKTARLCSRTCAERLSSSGVSGGGDTCVPEPRDGLSDEAEAEGCHSERRDRFSLAPVSPPRELQTALDNVLKCHAHKALVHDGTALANYLINRKSISPIDKNGRGPRVPGKKSSDSAEERGAHPILRYGNKEAVSYAASRLQATYGATFRVLSEIAQRVPSFRPETLLDFGSGLGTAVWAAHQLWGGSIYEYQCVDTSQEMGDMARLLRLGGHTTLTGDAAPGREAIPGVFFRQYLPVSGKVRYDMVVAAYTLGEIPSIRWRKISLASLWRKTKDLLVIVEPGTWSGYHNILEAREFLLDSATWMSPEYLQDSSDDAEGYFQGHVFAPCPHDLECPLQSGSKVPCHFAQRVHLSFTQKNSHLRHSGFHIEKFSYLVLRKGQKENTIDNPSRLLEPVKKRTGHVICKLCCQDGQAREIVFTKSKARSTYQAAREKRWGDLLAHPESGCASCHGNATDSK